MKFVCKLLAGVWLFVVLSSAQAAKPQQNLPLALPLKRAAALNQAPLPVRFPAEFEKQSALVLGGGELGQFFPELFVEIAQATFGQVPLVVLVSNEDERQLLTTAMITGGFPPEAVYFASVTHDTMWSRDYGPVVVERPNGSRVLVDADYFEGERKADDQVPKLLGKMSGMAVFHIPARIEGGNLLSNGQGVCLTTTTLVDRNTDRGIGQGNLKRLLHNFYGVRQTLFLEPLWGESTGHVDMFCTFTSPQTVLVGQYDVQTDLQNAQILDRNAQKLAQLRTPVGQLRVIRLPMPPNQDGVWRSYANSILINGTALVPVYPSVCPDLDQKALAIYKQELPGWNVVGIDATQLIERGGALHCISLNLGQSGKLMETIAQHERRRQLHPELLHPLPIAPPPAEPLTLDLAPSSPTD